MFLRACIEYDWFHSSTFSREIQQSKKSNKSENIKIFCTQQHTAANDASYSAYIMDYCYCMLWVLVCFLFKDFNRGRQHSNVSTNQQNIIELCHTVALKPLFDMVWGRWMVCASVTVSSIKFTPYQEQQHADAV